MTANSAMSLANAANRHDDGNKKAKEPPKTRVFYLDPPPVVEDLEKICDQTVDQSLYPLASSFPKNIVVYDMSRFAGRHDDKGLVERLQDEWNHVLARGPGVVVLKGLYSIDGLGPVVDAANGVLDKVLEEEHAAFHSEERKGVSDTGYKLDKNLKTANAFSKLAVRDPQTFIQYYGNPWLRYVSEAWVGPGYRFNTSLNIVPPGGQPQPAHRDYHMGFYDAEKCSKFPRLVQVANQILTLQGAVAHSDMPLPSGPTRFLPFSQLYEAGYMAARRPEFQDYFNANYVSVGLEKGDGVFFSPSVFHAAGENKTQDFYRNAHLIQINSNFGKPSEFVNSVPIINSCWDLLLEQYNTYGLNSKVQSLVAAIGDGYPFSTALDRLVNGVADVFSMRTEQELITSALEQGHSRDQIVAILKQNQQARYGVFLNEF